MAARLHSSHDLTNVEDLFFAAGASSSQEPGGTDFRIQEELVGKVVSAAQFGATVIRETT
jgi:hypothetical protein